MSSQQISSEIARLQSEMLDWYDRHRRVLPWRALPGETPDPYRVWLSEIMLQQTTVVTVGPYFANFTEKWPKVEALAAAELDEVLHAWAGLGYYARARNLYKCAGVVAKEYGGVFPADEQELLQLPGIGPYTAAAVAAIAFNLPASPVDGNIERVISRLRNLTTPLPDVKPEIKRHSSALTPVDRPGDFAQALMDLGATICTPRKPACGICPWQSDCVARKEGAPDTLPAKRPKKQKPTRYAHMYWLIRPEDGAVFIRRRPETGLLGGLYEFPSSDWEELERDFVDVKGASAPADTQWHQLQGMVRHTFTHFHLELTVHLGLSDNAKGDGVWCALDKLGAYALPTVMQKAAKHAIKFGSDIEI